MKITLALDAMGGDHGPSVVLPAAAQALARHQDLSLILVGDEAKLTPQVKKLGLDCHPRLEIQHASQVVEMDDKPSEALRYKRDSSMRVAVKCVKTGRAHAAVSAGNTGALMVTSRFLLKTIPGIDRPAILAKFPHLEGTTRVVDLGANIDSTAEHLFQFGVMGSILAQAIDGIEKPRVALLNIGEEEIKGNEQVKETAQLFQASELINYTGFVEGNDLFLDKADVIVCDGFVGNVSLKTTEGVAKLIANYIKRGFSRSWFTKLVALLAMPVLSALKKDIDPARYNGASLLGLNGIVVKSHGGTNILGFRTAIEEAIAEVKQNIPELIRAQSKHFFKESQTNDI